jgi:hypothetical protein
LQRKEKSVTRTPERIRAARGAWLAARDAWLAAIAALEAHRLEVNRLWLEYLELADPVRARKIRRILKHGEQGAAKTAHELFPAAVSLALDVQPDDLRVWIGRLAATRLSSVLKPPLQPPRAPVTPPSQRIIADRVFETQLDAPEEV